MANEMTEKLYIAQAVVKIQKDGTYSYEHSDSQVTTTNGIFNNFNSTGVWTIGSADSTSSIQYQIYQFGIQSLPGFNFTINSNDTATNAGDYSGVVIGQTGIFELDLHNTTPVTNIQIENIIGQLIGQGSSEYNVNYCYIDLVYGIISVTNTSTDKNPEEENPITPPDDGEDNNGNTTN